MKNIRMEWANGAFRELRTHPDVAADLDRRGEAVGTAANNGGGRHAVHSTTSGGRGRHRTVVVTANRQAIRNSARNDNLLRALDAGR